VESDKLKFIYIVFSKGGLFFSQKEQSPFWNPPKKRLGASRKFTVSFAPLILSLYDAPGAA
jgi:hypothetical protein